MTAASSRAFFMHADATGARPSLPLSATQIRSIVMGLMTAMLLAALDQTIVATAMPTIGRELGDVDNLPWIVTAYLLASTAVTPLYGKLSDIHGRRVMLLLAIATFMVGSVACALAPTMLGLAMARAVQGFGGGGLISLAQTILGDIMSPRERARYQAFIAGVFALSSLAGPLLGGFLSEHFGWPVIFWINLPLGLLAFLLTHRQLKLLPRHERPHRVDYPGAMLLIVATVTLLVALSWAGVRYAWTSPQILLLAFGSVIGWASFLLRLRTAREPLIPLEVLSDQVVYTATLSACFAMGTFIGLTIYVPIFLEGVLGYSASQSGLALVPLMIGTVTGATISGRSMTYFRHYKRLPVAGMVAGIGACAVLAFRAETLPHWLLEVLLLLVSLGLGTILPLSTITIQNTVPFHQLGTATATMNFFRALGGAIIVAVFGTILLSGLTAGGTAGHDLASVIRGSDASHLAGVFRWIFAAADCGLLLALLFLVMLEERPLVDRRAQNGGAELEAQMPHPIMD